MRRTFGRKSPRDQKIAVNAAFNLYGPSLDQFKTVIAPKREQRPQGANGRPLERNVLKSVVKALRADSRVERIERNTSGLLMDGDRMIRVGRKGKLDLTVYLRGGKWAEIEVKRDERTEPEEHQFQRIERIRATGGIAGWCWDAASALAILPS